MFYKSHFGTILTSVLSMFMGLVMAIFIIFLNHLPFNWVNLFELTAEINLIVFFFSLFIPYNAWGDWFAGPASSTWKKVRWPTAWLKALSLQLFWTRSTPLFVQVPASSTTKPFLRLPEWQLTWMAAKKLGFLASLFPTLPPLRQ